MGKEEGREKGGGRGRRVEGEKGGGRGRRGREGEKGGGDMMHTYVTCKALSPDSVNMPTTQIRVGSDSPVRKGTRSHDAPSLQDHKTEEVYCLIGTETTIEP